MSLAVGVLGVIITVSSSFPELEFSHGYKRRYDPVYGHSTRYDVESRYQEENEKPLPQKRDVELVSRDPKNKT